MLLTTGCNLQCKITKNSLVSNNLYEKEEAREVHKEN